MLNLKRILCPTDFSEFSDRALVYARDMATRFQAKLYVQHVTEDVFFMVPDVDMAAADIQALRKSYEHTVEEQLSQRLDPEITYTKLLTRGNPAQDILQVAQEQAIDLIIMGTHGRKGLRRLVLGSITEQVIKRAPCPVLTVCHAAYEPRRPMDFPRVLVSVDFSDASLHALEYALSLAETYRSELYLLNVVEHLPTPELAGGPIESEYYVKQSLAAVQERLARVIPEEIRKRCSVKELVKTGGAHREIVHAAREIDADLIVMGVVGHRTMETALFGSTAYRVVKEAHCPVLTVREWPKK